MGSHRWDHCCQVSRPDNQLSTASYRPRFSLAAWGDLFNFSKWLFISNLINFLQSRSTDFILGRTVGTHGLGIFNVASEIAMMPATELVAPLNRAVYPAYSRLTASPDELQRRFLQVFGMIGLVAFPASFGLMSIAELAVKVLLGPHWLEAIPIVSLIAVCGLAGALQSNMHVYILAVGKPRVSTYFSGVLVLISLPIIIYCSLLYGMLGAAVAYLVSSLCALTGTLIVFSKLSKSECYQ
ncbi:MAG: oligosaccharide flippase family protein [Propionivibrio sp.]|nr:oligosaccharide flippase family protein [Propionivibrio sp.]